MEKKKVLLFTYSKANFGDDLFVYILANRYKNIEFYIQIQEPKYKKAFENLHNVIILNEAREVEKINVNEFDAFVYVGGSIFIESEYGKHEAKEFNKFIKKVKENGKPFFYMTCNFGPYKTNEYLQQIKENLKLCQGICFRDFESYDKFKDISSVSYAPDIAFSYDYRDIIEKKEKKSIGISVINLLIRENLKQKTDIYNDYINLLNNIIVSNNIKNVTEDGFSLQISDEMAIESAKINNIEITDEMKSLAENMTKASGRSELKMYKNGFDLWLNSFQTSLVAVGGSAALGFLVGLIPGIGASLAGTLLAAILPVISGEYCPNGIFVSYRFNQYLRVRPQ